MYKHTQMPSNKNTLNSEKPGFHFLVTFTHLFKLIIRKE